MESSISDSQKTQDLPPLGHPSTEDIYNHVNRTSAPEKQMTEELRRVQGLKMHSILQDSDIARELDAFHIQELREYFLTYPSAWHELKRKIHSYREFSRNAWRIGKNGEEHILSVFLRLGKKGQDVPRPEHDLEGTWRREILDNTDFIAEAAAEPSFLDSSHGQIQELKLTKDGKHDFIEKIIALSLASNIDDLKKGDIDRELKKLLPILIRYLENIFHIQLEIHESDMQSMHTLTEWVMKNIWGGHGSKKNNGIKGKNAWMLLKSLRAWGGYDQILAYHRTAIKSIPHVSEKLKDHGIHLTNLKVRRDTSFNDTIEIYHGDAKTVLSSGKEVSFQLEYRIKSMRSILLKLWESEDYNNIDAMRDTLGIAVIGKDLSSKDKIELITKMTELFADKGYIAKNKSFIDKDHEKSFKKSLKQAERKPIGMVSTTKKGKTSSSFRNAALSGFTKIGKDPIGIEVQFYDEETYNFWKIDHYTFDPLKIISAWARGSYFLTPKQLLDAIRNNIPRDVLETKLKKFPQQIIQDYMSNGLIIAYESQDTRHDIDSSEENGGKVYFVPRQYKELFRGKFSNMSEIKMNDSRLISFISHITSS